MSVTRDKREALAALDNMERMILRACPTPGEVRLERDTMIDLLQRFRGWVEAFPEPRPFRHRAYQPPHLRTEQPDV